jgi:Uma2 family endonuclease
VVWQEAAAPYLVVELLSPGKEPEDLGTAVCDTQQLPNKWRVLRTMVTGTVLRGVQPFYR